MCLRLEETETRGNLNTYAYFVGDAAGLTVTGELVADGAVGCDAAGLAAGCDPALPAGRKPRLLGLLNICDARLLRIFASFIAVSNNAVFRICFRWLVRPCVICCRTPGLSSVRFSVVSRRSASLKMYQRLLK